MLGTTIAFNRARGTSHQYHNFDFRRCGGGELISDREMYGKVRTNPIWALVVGALSYGNALIAGLIFILAPLLIVTAAVMEVFNAVYRARMTIWTWLSLLIVGPIVFAIIVGIFQELRSIPATGLNLVPLCLISFLILFAIFMVLLHFVCHYGSKREETETDSVKGLR